MGAIGPVDSFLAVEFHGGFDYHKDGELWDYITDLEDSGGVLWVADLCKGKSV